MRFNSAIYVGKYEKRGRNNTSRRSISNLITIIMTDTTTNVLHSLQYNVLAQHFLVCKKAFRSLYATCNLKQRYQLLILW